MMLFPSPSVPSTDQPPTCFPKVSQELINLPDECGAESNQV